ncbi:hypothetical protein Hanom_Chr17g01548851 [Helianthus anomalus]
MFRKHYRLSEGDVGIFTFDKQQGIEDQWSPTEKPCRSGGAGVKVNKTNDEYDDVVKDDGKCRNDDDANLCFEKGVWSEIFQNGNLLNFVNY